MKPITNRRERERLLANGPRVTTDDLPKAPFTELDTSKPAFRHLRRELYTNDLRPHVSATGRAAYHRLED
ncbi:MAG: hypothetical protein REI09_05360 [Candidatus Dactylopiibacterium sp.]|nr:hypothetical protein [Candidatus Dactylopiibacterium sp.]